jgi:hypothetical protein
MGDLGVLERYVLKRDLQGKGVRCGWIWWLMIRNSGRLM